MKIFEKKKELLNSINKASQIYIVAHKNMDLDAINSCIAFSYYLKTLNKESTIIIDDIKHESGVKKVLEDYSSMYKAVKSKDVSNTDESLLIILDTNKQGLVQNSELVDQFINIINIDHHDYKTSSIKKGLSIIDENSSSTCEMLTEFFEKEKLELNSKVSNLLLGGIVLDTNYFQLKTTKESFYYSYYLMNKGASMEYVNTLLKQNLDDYVKRLKIIASVKKRKGIAISRGKRNNIYNKEELAKAADILLTFKNIKASFVIGRISKDEIGISARSMGGIKVGKIMEKLGGGGDEFEAATVIKSQKIDEVVSSLNKIIKDI
ncbi:MAG: DHH family phosphoesterase [Bacilli bacterium]|nr:DHH family phosphoesterase [Bacilli bacterium]